MMTAAELDSFQTRYEGAAGIDHEAEIIEERYPLSTIRCSRHNPTSKGSKAGRRPTECRDPCPRRFLSGRGGPDQQTPRPTETVGHHAGLHNLTIQTRKRYMSRIPATIEVFHNSCCGITHLWSGYVNPLAISTQTFRLVPSKRCWTSFCLKTISRWIEKSTASHIRLKFGLIAKRTSFRSDHQLWNSVVKSIPPPRRLSGPRAQDAALDSMLEAFIRLVQDVRANKRPDQSSQGLRSAPEDETTVSPVEERRRHKAQGQGRTSPHSQNIKTGLSPSRARRRQTKVRPTKDKISGTNGRSIKSKFPGILRVTLKVQLASTINTILPFHRRMCNDPRCRLFHARAKRNTATCLVQTAFTFIPERFISLNPGHRRLLLIWRLHVHVTEFTRIDWSCAQVGRHGPLSGACPLQSNSPHLERRSRCRRVLTWASWPCLQKSISFVNVCRHPYCLLKLRNVNELTIQHVIIILFELIVARAYVWMLNFFTRPRLYNLQSDRTNVTSKRVSSPFWSVSSRWLEMGIKTETVRIIPALSLRLSVSVWTLWPHWPSVLRYH